MIAALIDHLWQSTLAAAAAALLVILLRGHAASIRYWVWFAASVKFLVPFSALVALGTAVEWRSATFSPAEEDWTVLIERVAQPMALLTSASGDSAPAAAKRLVDDGALGVATLALGVWLLGVVIVLGAWFVRWLRLRRLVLAARPLRVDVTGSIPVKATSSDIEPGVFGVFAPVVLVPEGLLQRLSPAQLHAVLEHEMCHVRRRDNLTAAVHMLVEALFWFHPLVWWIGARLLDAREQACDEAVLASGVDRNAYGEGLLEVCRFCVGSPLPCAAGVGAARALKDRMQRIARDARPRPLGLTRKAVLAGAAVALLGGPIGIGLFDSRPAAAQPAPAGSRQLGTVSIERIEESVNPPPPNGPMIRPDGVLMASHVPLRRLIAYGFDVDEHLVIGPPELDARRYSIKGTGGRRMVQNLLAEQFGLAVHRETRALPIFELVAVSDEPALPEGRPLPGRFIRLRPGALTLNDVPIDRLSHALATHLGRPVVDRTGLAGPYTLTLAWETAADEDAASLREPEALASALESQLGLSLIAGEGLMELLVVDTVIEPIDFPPPDGTLRLDSDMLDRYVGFYGIPEIGFIARVARNGEHLVVQVNAARPHSVYPRSESVFVASVSDFEVEFAGEGGTRVLVLHSGEVSLDVSIPPWGPPREASYPMWAPQLDAATAEPLLGDIEARFVAQTPIVGGDEIVQRIARVLAGQEALPPEDGFDPARALHDALERDWADAFATRGELVSASFRAVDRMGKDVYEIAFEHFAFDVVLGLDSEGTLTSLNYRIGAFPVVGAYSLQDGVQML